MSQGVPVSIYQFKDQLNMAERELSAFLVAVETLFGPEQAILSGGDWLDAIEQVQGRNQACNRDWRAITIAASSRLAHRLALASDKASDTHQDSFGNPALRQVAPDFAKQNSA
jgi:hypothetical protein